MPRIPEFINGGVFVKVKRKKSAAIAVITFYLLPALVMAQISSPTALNAVCIEEQASGFNWKGGRWQPAKYQSDEKLHIRRLTPEEVSKDAAETFDRPISCLNMDLKTAHDVSGFGETGKLARRACYSIKEFGKEALLMISAELCTEIFNNTVLEKVECKSMHFSPNGLFIRLPWYQAMNTSSKPQNDYKDSLVIAVGKCSVLD